MTKGLQALSLLFTADEALTLGPLAFTANPQIEQCRTLFQEWIGVLHANPINFIHIELEFSGQLYMGIREGILKHLRACTHQLMICVILLNKHSSWSCLTNSVSLSKAQQHYYYYYYYNITTIFLLNDLTGKSLWLKHFLNFKETTRLQTRLENT